MIDLLRVKMLIGNRFDQEKVGMRVDDVRELVAFWEDGHAQLDEQDAEIEYLERHVGINKLADA